MSALRVFITGASSGLGRALAFAYARRGAVIGLLARRQSTLQRIAGSLGTASEIYDVDVRDKTGVARAATDFLSRHGGADIVIANAGISVGTSADDDAGVLEETLAINVLGLANTLRPFVSSMCHAGAGKLVGIASVAGYRGFPGSGPYCASKAAVISYLESLRVELRTTGVKVITISPGYIATPMSEANPYRMPFLLSAEDAATRMLRIIDGGRSYAVIPWQMAIVARLLRVLPNAVHDRLFANAPRKPDRKT